MRKIDGMIPTNYADATTALRGKLFRTLASNTSLVVLYHESKQYPVAVRLHTTDIVTFYRDGSIALNSGGWRTVTTKARMNAALARTNYRVVQVKNEWRIRYGYELELSRPFEDGIILPPITVST